MGYLCLIGHELIHKLPNWVRRYLEAHALPMIKACESQPGAGKLASKEASRYSNRLLAPGLWVLFSMLLMASNALGQEKAKPSGPPPTKIRVNGVELHYIERGKGDPVVFVHGGLEDYRAWDSQIGPFAEHFRVISYSRRYNFPNKNNVVLADHSAIVEADDLAALLKELHIQRAHLIGNSYGALTVLTTALKHPELVLTLTLAEPPVHRWVTDAPGGKEVFEQFMAFWNDAGGAFRRGDSLAALRVSTTFFTEGQATYESLPAQVRSEMAANIAEWRALTTSHDAFPPVDRNQVRRIKSPTLLLCGEKTLKIHQFVNDELDRLLKGNKGAKRIMIAQATHDMWSEQPEVCRRAVFEFLGLK
jgi:non-heme chloroperoxidase